MHAHLTPGELCRQTIHMGAGLLAFAVRWLGALPLAVLALAGVFFNAWLLPRLGGRGLWRQRETEADRAPGMVLYPLSVLMLLLLFYRWPEVAAAGWGLLAFGDGAASLAGQLRGRRRLPWNREKSWAGLAAYWLAGWLAVGSLLSWTAPSQYPPVFAWSVAGAVALLGAMLESAPQGLDDNLRVPLVASLFLLCLLWTEGEWPRLLDSVLLREAVVGLAVNAVLAAVGFALATLDRGGAVAACLLGTAVFAFVGWQGYLVLMAFFVLGSSATRLGFEVKRRQGLAQAAGGRRRAANALANGGVPAACALFVYLTPYDALFTLAFAGALAAAAADTVESEIGQLWGRPTVLITTLQRVEPGTDGGVSLVGTSAGLLAAGLVVVVGWATRLYAADAVVPLTLLALLATVLESVAGATLERRGLLDNDGVNFLNTLSGALLGAALAVIAG